MLGRNLPLFHGPYDLLRQGAQKRVAFYHQGDFSGSAKPQRIGGGVKADDVHIGAYPVSMLPEGLYGAEGFVVVFTVHHIKVLTVRQGIQVVPQGLIGFGLGKVPIQAGENLPVRMAAHRLLQGPGTADLGCGAHGSLDVDDLDGVCPFGIAAFHPLHRADALPIEIRPHMGRVQAVILHIRHTVNQDYRNPRLLRLLQHGIPAGFTQGHQHNVIHLLLNEFSHRCDLVLLLLAGIGKQEPIALIL